MIIDLKRHRKLWEDFCDTLIAKERESEACELLDEVKKKVKSDELRPEYRREDLGAGVRGKHLEAYRAGTNLVLLSPDVAKVFPTQEAVNDALRSLIDIAQKSVGPDKALEPTHQSARLSFTLANPLLSFTRMSHELPDRAKDLRRNRSETNFSLVKAVPDWIH